MIRLLLLCLWVHISFAQQIEAIDFLHCKANLSIFPLTKEVKGTVTYSFLAKKDIDSVYLDAKNVKVTDAQLADKKIDYDVSHTAIVFKKKFKKGEIYSLSINYIGRPKKAMYFIDWEYKDHPEANPQIWTQGQGKYTSNWLPSIDDMNDKMVFDLTVRFDENYQVIANGKLENKTTNNGFTSWHYTMQKPMSSYLVALAIGAYKKKRLTAKSGVPIDLYYYPKDSLRFESTYRHTQQIFSFLEIEIGVPYPWQNYKQVPVKDFLYAGMENTSLTIFSDDYVIDSTSFVDKNYVNVNAHELAHQWFGNMVTETNGTHHWLHEGFATYYALLAERDVFGADYYQKQLETYAQEIRQAQDKDTIPLLHPKASSLTFYKKGALALHSLRSLVGGKVFREAVQDYLLAYQMKNVTTNNFLDLVAQKCHCSLEAFKNDWLLSSTLVSNVFLTTQKSIDVTAIHTSSFNTKSIKERQELAVVLQKVPDSLQKQYEKLLKDSSYITQETALFNLWLSFPEQRKKYLDTTANLIGFNNKNIKTLWLALALNTRGFPKEKYALFFEDLVAYTHPAYHFELRKNAFQYLYQLNLVSSEVLQHLQQATRHHNWRFRSYCKQLYNRITQNKE